MINETILHLPPNSFAGTRLAKFEQELGGSDGVWDSEFRYAKSLREIFSKVIQYDYCKKYAELGVLRTNRELIQVVRSEHPKYLFWPSMSYEIQESTFQAIRKEGTLVIGWFFDDEVRFDDYSKWWIPYLDYALTTDKQSVKKYQELGATTMHLLVTANPDVCRRLEIQKRYDVSFVGSKIADRGSIVDQLRARGIQVQTFGSGWSSGPVSLDELVNIYNASKINLCFVKSYGVNTRPQMKDKIFDICMCGGFLLCEYIPGIEDFFEIDKEIVCFRDIEEAAIKIRYYLDHEAERQAIAQAGWERSKHEHSQTAWLLRIFEEIEKDIKSGKRRDIGKPGQLDMPQHIRKLPSSYHLRWANVLMREGFERKRWQEELDLALFYDPENIEARRLTLISHLPAFVRPGMIHRWAAVGRLKQALWSSLVAVPVLRKILQRYEIDMQQYTKDYKIHQEGSRQSAKEIVPLVLELIQPKRVIDVGCGVGGWLSVFKECGVEDILGIDGDWVDKEMLQIPEDRFLLFDLKESFRMDRQFDLVVSVEVAEHLPYDCAETFVDSLVRLGPVILFSAAIPFQEGTHHVNEQWPDYWVKRFQNKGYVVIDCLRKKIWENDKVEWWYAQNILMFVSRDYLESTPLLKKEFENTNISMLSIVHPKNYLEKYRESHDPSTMSLKEVLSALLVEMKNTLKRVIKRLLLKK